MIPTRVITCDHDICLGSPDLRRHIVLLGFEIELEELIGLVLIIGQLAEVLCLRFPGFKLILGVRN